VNSAKEREEGGYYVSTFLRIGRDGFADVAAAIASLRAADGCELAVEAYNSAKYARPVYVFPAPPGLREFVEKYEHLSRNKYFVDIPVHELAAANAPGAEYCRGLCSTCEVGLCTCEVKLYFIHGLYLGRRIYIELELYLADHSREEAGLEYLSLDLLLSLSADIVEGSKLGVGASYFPMSPNGIANIARRMRKRFRVPEANIAPLLDLMVWLAKKSRRKWGDTVASTAAGAAAALLPAAVSTSYEIQRAFRIRVSGLEYPAIEEVAEEVRREALEVYSRVAEKVAAAGHKYLPNWAGEIKIKDYMDVWEVMLRATSSSSVEASVGYARAAAEGILGRAAAKATAARAAAEVLASLSDPE